MNKAGRKAMEGGQKEQACSWMGSENYPGTSQRVQ